MLAYSPIERELVHVETSSDAMSWPEREKRMRKKFRLPHEAYEKVFNVKVAKVKKMAMCGFSYENKGMKWDDIEVKSVREFVCEI